MSYCSYWVAAVSVVKTVLVGEPAFQIDISARTVLVTGYRDSCSTMLAMTVFGRD
jgi:hypothetical protein